MPSLKLTKTSAAETRQTQNATVVTYDYDHNGMRVRKTVANTSGYVYTTYNYTWHGGQLAHMTKGTDELHFFYDAQGRPAKVNYNGTIYTYVHNLQGDIVGILDGNGTIVVEYKYNAWGAQLSRTGDLANTLGYANPFRYRGYIYDDETWMYWLRSRYYYPELHRFISTDNVMDGAGLFGANLYAYCKNAPVGASDPSGHTAAGAVLQQSGAAAQILIGALGSAAAAAASPWLLAVACVGGLLMLAGAASNTHTNARSRTEIRSALLSASYGDANARDHSYNTGDYYAAFTIQYPGVNFVSLYYLKEPLTLDEAVDLLTFDALIGALSRAYGFRSSEFGIYTDTEGAASALAAATNGSIDFENHAKKGCRPGDYYTHYHAFAPIHGPHIWFGPPTTILYN